MSTDTVSTGATPVDAAAWILQKQLMTVEAMIRTARRVQRDAASWKQAHSNNLSGWEDLLNQEAYQACYSVMDSPQWLRLPAMEERRAELKQVQADLNEENYEPVIKFLIKEHDAFIGHNLDMQGEMSLSAFSAIADELWRLTLEPSGDQ